MGIFLQRGRRRKQGAGAVPLFCPEAAPGAQQTWIHFAAIAHLYGDFGHPCLISGFQRGEESSIISDETSIEVQVLAPRPGCFGGKSGSRMFHGFLVLTPYSYHFA